MIYFISNQSTFHKSDKYEICTVDFALDYLNKFDVLAVDTETTGRDPHIKKILSLQVGTAEHQFVIDCRSVNIKLFKSLLESKTCICHNAKFDYKFLKMSGITMEYIYDTMLVECVIFCGYPQFGYALAALANRYCDVYLNKETRGEFFMVKDQAFTEAQIVYAGKDVSLLHIIRDKQIEMLRKYDLEYCAINIECEVVKALADIELNGMFLNPEKWAELSDVYEEEVLASIKVLDNMVLSDPILSKYYKPNGIMSLFGDEERQLNINYSSPKQMKELINRLGFNIDATDDAILEDLKDEHPIFKVLQTYREGSKRVTTYGKGFLDYINKNTGRVHTDFWQVLTTGRVSSGSKDMNAPNLQNIPASTDGELDNRWRNCFEARKGFLWVSGDYSGQELRIMSDASNESTFIDSLNRGEDPHCFAGEMMFKRPIDKKKDKDLRQKAKAINFGKPYGMGPKKLADRLKISSEEAYELFDLYKRTFPKLEGWLESQQEFAKRNGYSKTMAPSKRRRWYPDMKTVWELRKKHGRFLSKSDWEYCNKIEGQTGREGGNQPIQGTGADICKEALVDIRNLVKSYNERYNEPVAYLICTVHDQIDVEVREDLAEEFSKEMAYRMKMAGNKYVTKVEMEVDITITTCWTK